MAYNMRSFVCNKIIQAVNGSIGGKGIRPSDILPLIKICPNASDSIEYQLEYVGESSPVKSKKKFKKGLSDKPTKPSFSISGPELANRIQLDDFVTAAYFVDLKFPKINFKVCNKKITKEVLNIVCDHPDSFWNSSALFADIPKQKIIVDFSSPNIAKPFHMGHLRSTIIGNFISNLYSSLGHDVTRINYLGDWGIHFGLLKYGYDTKELSETDLKENPIKFLYELYDCIKKESEKSPAINEKAREIFKLMERGNEEHMQAFNMFRSLFIKELEKCYRRLNINFDEYHGESMYKLEHCTEIIDRLKKKGFAKKLPDGRKVFLHTERSHPITILKSDGSTLYLTRDIAAAIHRQQKYKFDKMFYVVEKSQHNHFLALKRILTHLEYEWANNIEHVSIGKIEGMRTRKGNVLFLEDILDEAKELTLEKQLKSENMPFESNSEKNVEIADVVGCSSILFADLKKTMLKDYEFSWDDVVKEPIKDMGGLGPILVGGPVNTKINDLENGAHLQYLQCRLNHLEENCGISYNSNTSLDSLQEPEAIDLVKHIARFDEVLYATYKELEAKTLALYLCSLSNSINQAYKVLPITATSTSTAEDRLKLFRAAKLTLFAGMKILGMSSLNQS